MGLRLRMMMMRRMRTRQDYGGEKRLKEGLLRQKDTREERKGGNYAGAEEKHKSIKRGVPGVLTVQGKGKNPRRKTGKNKRGRCSNFRQDTLCRGVKSQGKERRKKSKQNKKKITQHMGHDRCVRVLVVRGHYAFRIFGSRKSMYMSMVCHVVARQPTDPVRPGVIAYHSSNSIA